MESPCICLEQTSRCGFLRKPNIDWWLTWQCWRDGRQNKDFSPSFNFWSESWTQSSNSSDKWPGCRPFESPSSYPQSRLLALKTNPFCSEGSPSSAHTRPANPYGTRPLARWPTLCVTAPIELTAASDLNSKILTLFKVSNSFLIGSFSSFLCDFADFFLPGLDFARGLEHAINQDFICLGLFPFEYIFPQESVGCLPIVFFDILFDLLWSDEVGVDDDPRIGLFARIL